jgi:hypothetical protein
LFVTRFENADRRHEDEKLSLRPMARDKGQADRCGWRCWLPGTRVDGGLLNQERGLGQGRETTVKH